MQYGVPKSAKEIDACFIKHHTQRPLAYLVLRVVKIAGATSTKNPYGLGPLGMFRAESNPAPLVPLRKALVPPWFKEMEPCANLAPGCKKPSQAAKNLQPGCKNRARLHCSLAAQLGL